MAVFWPSGVHDPSRTSCYLDHAPAYINTPFNLLNPSRRTKQNMTFPRIRMRLFTRSVNEPLPPDKIAFCSFLSLSLSLYIIFVVPQSPGQSVSLPVGRNHDDPFCCCCHCPDTVLWTSEWDKGRRCNAALQGIRSWFVSTNASVGGSWR